MVKRRTGGSGRPPPSGFDTGCGSYGVPPPFACHDPVVAENCVGIVENKRGGLEREAVVLLLVDPVLFTVPFEPHRYTKCIT